MLRGDLGIFFRTAKVLSMATLGEGQFLSVNFPKTKVKPSTPLHVSSIGRFKIF